MLTIRKAQMEIFARDAMRRFRSLLADHLREFYPSRVADLDSEQLDLSIERAVRLAESFGIRSEQGLYRFIALCGSYGFDFLEQPANAWMAAILRDTRISAPESRLLYLFDLSRQREEAAAQSRALRQAFLEA